MPGEDTINLDGVVVERLGNGLVRVELANGHRVLAHAARREQEHLAGLAAGSRVRLQMTPFDMSVGRLVFEKTLNSLKP